MSWVTKNGTAPVDITQDDFDDVGNMITRKITNHRLDFDNYDISTPRNKGFGNINRLLNVKGELNKSLEIPKEELIGLSDDNFDILSRPSKKSYGTNN